MHNLYIQTVFLCKHFKPIHLSTTFIVFYKLFISCFRSYASFSSIHYFCKILFTLVGISYEIKSLHLCFFKPSLMILVCTRFSYIISGSYGPEPEFLKNILVLGNRDKNSCSVPVSIRIIRLWLYPTP